MLGFYFTKLRIPFHRECNISTVKILLENKKATRPASRISIWINHSNFLCFVMQAIKINANIKITTPAIDPIR